MEIANSKTRQANFYTNTIFNLTTWFIKQQNWVLIVTSLYWNKYVEMIWKYFVKLSFCLIKFWQKTKYYSSPSGFLISFRVKIWQISQEISIIDVRLFYKYISAKLFWSDNVNAFCGSIFTLKEQLLEEHVLSSTLNILRPIKTNCI